MDRRSPVVLAASVSSDNSDLSFRLSVGCFNGVPRSRPKPTTCGRRLSAPPPHSNSDSEDGGDGPSFSIQGPSGFSESGGSDAEDGVVQSRRLSSGAPALLAGARPLGPAEVALAEVTARLDQALQLHARRNESQFQRDLAGVDAAEHLALVAASEERQREVQALAAVDAQRRARRNRDREQLLHSLRSQHEQKAAEAAHRVAQLEAASKERQLQERAAAEAKQREAEAQKAALAAAEQQREVAEAQQRQVAGQAAKSALAQQLQQREAAAKAAASDQPGILTISASAAQFREQCAQRLAAAQAAAAPFVEDRAMRDVKRSIDKFVTLNVQQISATLEQVRAKAQALAGFVAQHHGAQRTYALLQLANKLVSQCEVQITRLHAFAFPLAEVAVAVAAAHPDLVDLLLGRLHQASPLAVPCYYGFRPGSDEVAYLRLAGYRVTEEEGGGGVHKESTDEYVARQQGYVMLYAAITQSDNPSSPHGLQHAWAYMARLLNALPPTRATAAALDAFLKVAGYRMAATYRNQFVKMLGVVGSAFLPELSAAADPDARAVYTRLQTYLRTRQFAKAPEGRDMPRHDASSYDRA